jgi:hypothetical protein
MAYDKYKQHKVEKRAIQLSQDVNQKRISQESLSDQANTEILENMAVHPPDYEVLVAERAIVPPEMEGPVDGKRNSWVYVPGEDRLAK